MRYLPYPEYRNLSVGWFGCTPKGWQIKRLRFATRGIEQGWSPQCDNQAAEENAWGVMKVGCVNGNEFDSQDNKALPQDLEPKPEYELHPGDILISRANTKELLGSAAIVPNGVRSKLLLCDKLFRLHPEPEVNERFLTYFLRTPTARFQYEREATGASGSMQNIGQDTLRNLLVPLPDSFEQKHIAAFLDWKTGQIDALIAKKQALIEKLKEKRLAVITQAVTKGLAASAPLRDSGVQWLGVLPDYWEVIPLGFLIRILGGMTPSMANSAYWEGDVPWVSPKDMKRSRISDSIDHITEQALAETSISLVPVNSVLIVVRGMILAHSFPTAITERPVTINQDMKALQCDDKLEVEYLFWCLSGFAKVLTSLAQESAHGTRKIETDTLKKLPFPVPPLSEQREICAQIALQLNKLDCLVDTTEKTVVRLTEYRTALITATTTGQIDVRQIEIPAQA